VHLLGCCHGIRRAELNFFEKSHYWVQKKQSLVLKKDKRAPFMVGGLSKMDGDYQKARPQGNSASFFSRRGEGGKTQGRWPLERRWAVQKDRGWFENEKKNTTTPKKKKQKQKKPKTTTKHTQPTQTHPPEKRKNKKQKKTPSGLLERNRKARSYLFSSSHASTSPHFKSKR